MGVCKCDVVELCLHIAMRTIKQIAITCALLGATGCRKLQLSDATDRLPDAVAVPQPPCETATVNPWLASIWILLIVAGAAAAFYGMRRTGLTVVASGILGLITTLAVIRYERALAITGSWSLVAVGVALVVAGCVWGYRYLKQPKI
jgi:hypothetical protein